MQPFHPARGFAVFDEPNLVSFAGALRTHLLGERTT
jgi:hypothetical protein